MKATEFRIESQNDAASFENLVDQYCLKHNIVQSPLIMKLGDAYRTLKKDGRDPRCFSAYLDLYLQYIALQEDVSIIAAEINREYQSGIAEGFFAERMNRYIAASNAAHRIRAMWDKLMGITIMLHWHDKYDKFCEDKSKLGKYKKIAESWLIPKETLLSADSEQLKRYEQWNSSWAEEIHKIAECVKFISENYRTAEAHLVGRIWKWAFAIQRDEDDPFVELLNSSNDLIDHFQRISNLILLIECIPTMSLQRTRNRYNR